jgi:uncharacterized repeat protein (TIGR03803 family)
MTKKSQLFRVLMGAAALTLILTAAASAGAKENTLVRFNGADGSQPAAGLISDGKGNFFGAAQYGGQASCTPNGCGVVFELSPTASGGWKKTIIYAFKGGASDASGPTTNLSFDAKGNLFGGTATNLQYFGAIFELTPSTGGAWSEKVIHRFAAPYDDPGQQLVFDGQGNLYGSVLAPVGLGGGVFKLSPQPDGTWKETMLHTFSGQHGEGTTPLGGVLLDGNGNIFGTTERGGNKFNDGTVYELSPQASGAYKETILYTFTGKTDGGNPYSQLTIDAKGNLYGTTHAGGPVNGPSGVVFELIPSGGTWTEKVLYSFGVIPDGYYPSNVVFDAKGNLYGTTTNGGSECNKPGCGIVFRLTPQSDGSWKETILHNFEGANEGSESAAGVVIDNATGYIYGTTQYGGSRLGYGSVFQLQP